MIRYLFLAGLLLAGFLSRSQAPVAQFTASVVEGCGPLTVKFTDNSTGSPKFWDWDLGNGQLSNLQNPTVVYSTPGKYTIKLVVRNSDGLNGITKTEYITVFTPPTANIAADRNTICLPGTVQFKDLSNTTDGTINSWTWDFGDGTTSNLQNPVKAYTTQGFYSVTLTVGSSTGCTNYRTGFRFIRVLSGVKADFLDSVARVCKTPFDVTFLNQTTGPGNLTYSWDLGNGVTSTQKSPATTINTPGTFNVRLIAQSDLGCSDTSSKSVRLSSTNTAFTGLDSTCINSPVAFKNGSTDSLLSSRWDFGDGTGSLLANPSKAFTAAGTYQVKLVNNYRSCSDSIVKPIRIVGNPPVDFTSVTQGACKTPFPVTFQDLSPGAVSWLWNFGDGSTSTQQNPSHTYSAAGEYDVTLTMQTALGCKNTITKSKWIKITPPTVSVATAGGCIPFTFSPVATINSVDGVASYLWDFGDGTTSTQASPSHTYPNAGSYTLKLTITTNGGCTASVTLPNGVRTGTKPVPDFSVADDSVCVKAATTFRDLSTAVPGGVDQWLWSFGDTATSRDKNPIHAYSDTGAFTVKLTAFNNGCDESITKTRFIYVLPPVANFYDSVGCNDKLTAFFINKSVVSAALDPTTYLWEFGDPGNQTSTAIQPNFRYPAFGTYTVKLTVGNKSGCTSTFTKQVTLVNELADFTVSKPSVCNNETFTLSAITSNAANVSQYIWSINGGAPVVAGRNYQTSLPANGTYNVTLTIIDKYGCPDTKTKNGVVTVTGPTASFSSSISGGCRNAVATFTDASVPAAGINKWTFNFGDGTVQSYTAPPFSHQYKDTGSFAVQLTVQDGTGCTSTSALPTPVKISKPVVGFAVSDTLSCPGLPFQFTDASRTYGSASYLWNFGDGSSSTLQNPVHVYAAGNKTYTVSLTLQDSLGCSDSLSKANYVIVRSPKAAFEAKDTVSICLPLETTFYNKSENYESLYWDFGDGNTSSLDTTSNFYNNFGVFKAKLLAVGTGGCKDSSEVTVSVFDPSTSTTIDYRTVVECNSATVDFVITRPPLTSYTFYFGDGATDNSGRDTIQHVYGSPNAYFPSIYISDSIGCLSAIGGTKPVVILGANPFFSTDRNAFCDSGTVFFTNFTLGNDPVISSVWDFGDGNTSLDKDVIHNYTTPGQYIASLSINTQNGCAKTLTDTINVYATPVPSIGSDSLFCINSLVQLTGELAFPDSLVKWNWNLGNGQTSTAANPSVVYNKEGSYTITLEATNILGCKGTTTKTIFVKPLPVITVLQEPVIPVGSGITLPVSYSPDVQSYRWTPATALTCTTCPNPIANPTINTTYRVAVRDSLGCLSSKELTVRVVCNEKNYFVPNTFTPNGDGVNDYFYPRGNNINRVQSMRIFNRWGEMIFEKRNFAANNQADGWNGTYKGKAAASDAYVYVVEFICENGTIIPFKGNVSLVR